MIDSVLNLLFRCSHRRLTRPITLVIKTGQSHGGTYVVCLDCGRQFAYDFKEMKIGKAIDRSPDVGVLPPNNPKPRKTKFRYALLAALPAAVVLGAVLKGRNKSVRAKARKADPAAPDDVTLPEG
jgi:hypothetical protein